MQVSWYESVMQYKDLPEEDFFKAIATVTDNVFEGIHDHYRGSYAKGIVTGKLA